MKALQDLEIFVRTVDSGSLSATARALGMTPAAASAALKRLELELQATLLVRSTRKVQLTPAGTLFLQHCRAALDTIRDGQQALFTGQGPLLGLLRLAVSGALGRHLVLPWLEAFGEQHPQLRFRLAVASDPLEAAAVDATFAYAEPPDPGRMALPLAPGNRRVLCAAPHYLARHGTPATPQALGGHDCLCFSRGQEVSDGWSFWRDGEEQLVRVRGGHASNDGDVMRRWAVSGRGVAYLPGIEAADDLRHGHLVALCTGWLTEPAPLVMLLGRGTVLTPALRLLQDFVAQKVAALGTGPGGGDGRHA